MNTDLTPTLSALLNRLRQFALLRKTVLAVLCLGWGLPSSLALLVLFSWFDAVWHFQTFGRFMSEIIFLLPAIAAITLAVKILTRRQSDEAVARLAEIACPNMDNVLINAVQFAKNDTLSAPLVEKLIKDAPALPERIPLANTIPMPYIRRLRWVIPAILVFCMIPFCWRTQKIATSIQRIILPFADILPYTDTKITSITPGDTLVRRGLTVNVHAVFTDVLPETAAIEWQPMGVDDNAPILEIVPMSPGEDANQSFQGIIPAVHTNLRYRIRANDALSKWYTLSVDNPPGLVSWSVHYLPPPYTGLPDDLLDSQATNPPRIPAGSRIELKVEATRPVREATLSCGDAVLAQLPTPKTPAAAITLNATLPQTGILKLAFSAGEGLDSTCQLPIAIIPDTPPAISLVNTPLNKKVSADASIPITFVAQDDYGVGTVQLVQLLPDAKTDIVTTVTAQPKERKRFQGRFVVDVNTFNLDKKELKFRVIASEFTQDAVPRSVSSPIVTLSIMSDEESEAAKAKASANTMETLEHLLTVQRSALKQATTLRTQTAKGGTPSQAALQELHNAQKQVRSIAVAILPNRQILGVFGETLAAMVNTDMVTAINAAEVLNRTAASELLDRFQDLIKIQTHIIAQLTTINKETLALEEKHKARAGIFELFQKIIKDQGSTFKQTAKCPDQVEEAVAVELMGYQSTIARNILRLQEKLAAQSEEKDDDGFSEQLKKSLEVLTKGVAYDNATCAAEELEYCKCKPAADYQKKVIKTLAEAFEILNKWRVENAKETLKNAQESLSEIKKVLEQLEEKQAKIQEIARSLTQHHTPEETEKLQDELEKLKKKRDELMDMLEKLANDLYQFPELPLCNEVAASTSEIFEAVVQAKDSENTPKQEIAVQKEDSILDAIRNTTKRVEDVEMWLPDIPDNIQWHMESFDTDELPEIPLVELPEELQDIVGDLLEQDEAIDAESQDSTGNNIVADAEMGWAIMDGNMPSFAAKGKTGNTRPNDNEMTGRSGAGREGQANGELVENHVKGYEGRETHARRTGDPFQKGEVTEDEESTFKARATGGGKLGGEAESQGMFGNAPRRDLKQPAHGTTPQALRQETDAVFAKARLLYVTPGAVAQAAYYTGLGDNTPPDLKGFDNLKKRVARTLQDSTIEIEDGTMLTMPVAPVTQQHSAGDEERDNTQLNSEYQDAIGDYYKSLSAPSAN